jgi:opacity protein-like surface antigen
VAWAIANNISLDLSYHFAGLGGAKSNSNDWYSKVGKVYMSQVMLGARFMF